MRSLISVVAASALTVATPAMHVRAAQTPTMKGEADAPTPAGKWTMTLETPHGTFAMTFDLTIDGDTVGGTLTSDATGVATIKGTFSDGKVAITADVAQGIDFHFTFKDKDTMTGNLSSPMGDMACVATRAKK